MLDHARGLGRGRLQKAERAVHNLSDKPSRQAALQKRSLQKSRQMGE
jgi:hypothetical protein